MLFQNNIGPVAASVGDGLTAFARAGRQQDLMVSELHGSGYEQSYRGNMFSVANQAAVSTSSSLNTTFTGLSLANPSTSGVNLVMRKFSVAQFAVGAAAVISLAGVVGVAAGSLVVRSTKVGVPYAGATIASAGATITAPILLRPLCSVGSLATTGYGLQGPTIIDLGGDLIVPPGAMICTDTSVATTTALIFGFVWEEVPV